MKIDRKKIKPFKVGDPVTVIRAGRISQILTVKARKYGILTLSDDTLWSEDGVPISAGAQGGRLAATLKTHEGRIDKARQIGRLREMFEYLSTNARLYNVGGDRLLALERTLQHACEESTKVTTPERDGWRKRFAVRLQAAEHAEVMRLAQTGSDR
jgi:hypothetical protein